MDQVPILLEAAVASFAVLGGVMAFSSGWLAARAFWSVTPTRTLSDEIDIGIAVGFTFGLIPALWAFSIVLGT